MSKDNKPTPENIRNMTDDELTEHLTTCIKNGYNVADKLYSFIKEIEKPEPPKSNYTMRDE